MLLERIPGEAESLKTGDLGGGRANAGPRYHKLWRRLCHFGQTLGGHPTLMCNGGHQPRPWVFLITHWPRPGKCVQRMPSFVFIWHCKVPAACLPDVGLNYPFFISHLLSTSIDIFIIILICWNSLDRIKIKLLLNIESIVKK